MMEGLNTILQSGNTHRIAKAKYEQTKSQQESGNKVKKAQGDLATWSRSLSNKRRVAAAEKKYNANIMQLNHEMKQAGKQQSNLSLQYAEAQGRVRAQAAFSGVGGSTVEAIENLVALQTATSEQELHDAISNMGFFGKEQSAKMVADAYNSQDMSQTMVEFDYNVHISPKPLKYKWLKVAGVAAATVYGGPMAGEAAADAFVGMWQAENGDFAGASKSFGQAFQGGAQAFNDWNDRGGTAWAKDAFSGYRASGGGNDYAKVSTGNKASSASNKKVGGNKWF